MELKERHLYEFGPFRLEPAEHLLVRDGQVIPLAPKVFDTLLVLVQNSGHLVDKDELLRRVWPDTFVEEGNLTKNIFALRKILEGGRENEKFIETIPKRGYRFVAPVTELKEPSVVGPKGDLATRVVTGVGEAASDQSVRWQRILTSWRVAVLAGLALALVVGVFVFLFLLQGSRDTHEPEIGSLAVLPLENLSGDASQNYLADGLTEELITRLSKLPNLSVIARTTVLQQKRSGATVDEIARTLGVQAFVEGSVVREHDRVRVTARLLDPAGGRTIWSERYDRVLADVAAIEGDIASAIGGAIRSSVTPEERRRVSSAPPTDSQAYDLYLRGRFHAGRESPEEIAQAIDFLERAVAADPTFAAAHAELARAYGQRLFYVAPGDRAVQERAFVEIERGLALDPDLDAAHLARGLLLWQPWNHFPHDRAIASFRRAIALNPNSDEAHHQLGLVYLHVGLLDEAKREIDEAVRLNPANTLAHFREGVIALYGGNYSQAAEIFKGTPPNFQPPLRAFQLADSFFHLGRKDEARATVESYLEANPEDIGGLNTAFSALLAADAGNLGRLDPLVQKAQENGRGFGHFHHTAFTISRAFALAGRPADAVKWLQQAADDGYPCYPAFENDSALNRIRGVQLFKDFLAGQRAVWEGFRKLAQ
jgi:TolB-like protein/DNA-binding winged helix-turn-helix (wHTH) protein